MHVHQGSPMRESPRTSDATIGEKELLSAEVAKPGVASYEERCACGESLCVQKRNS